MLSDKGSYKEIARAFELAATPEAIHDLKISRDELLEILTQVIPTTSTNDEDAHICADMALLAYIDDDEVSRAFLNVGRFYG